MDACLACSIGLIGLVLLGLLAVALDWITKPDERIYLNDIC